MNLRDAYSAFGPKRSGDTLVSTKVCSRCQRRVTEYRFTACEGFAIATYHCMEHGDVIPTRVLYDRLDLFANPREQQRFEKKDSEVK